MQLNNLKEFLESFAPSNNVQKWDNTGHLIQTHNNCNRILLTIDFTKEVLQECIDNQIDFVLSYHPVIFKPLKQINEFYAKIIKNNISIYSIHTALDLRMCKYLAKLLNLEISVENITYIIAKNEFTNKQVLDVIKKLTEQDSLRYCLDDLNQIYKKIIIGVGAFQSFFIDEADADTLIITGEIRHHEMLELKSKGSGVIITEHSNGERLYLREFQKELKAAGFEVFLSKFDKDPVSFY
ncbi:NGG1 interacting factor [Gurleya vavrai]